MESIQAIGVIASVLAAVIMAVAWWDIARRRPFPDFRHGAVRVAGRHMKWVWAVALAIAFLAGGPETRSWTTTERGLPAGSAVEAEAGAAAGQTSRVRVTTYRETRLAAYRHAVSHSRETDGATVRTERVSAHVPVWLALVLALYWLFVIRKAAPRPVSRPS
jgi:TRAP-type C4-dicarboxylate transport system permease large subunit